MRRGRAVSLVSEERFNNKKNQFGFPEQSVNWILSKDKLSFSEFDVITLGDFFASDIAVR